MTIARTIGALSGGVALAALLLGTVPAPAGAAGPGLTSYDLHVQQVVSFDLPDGQGPCGTAATVTFDGFTKMATSHGSGAGCLP